MNINVQLQAPNEPMFGTLEDRDRAFTVGCDEAAFDDGRLTLPVPNIVTALLGSAYHRCGPGGHAGMRLNAEIHKTTSVDRGV